jgi:hypothetical protein
VSQLTLLPPAEDPQTATGFVYLMTDGYLIKVGYTGRRDVKQRSGELRAELLSFWPGTREDERRLKAQLKPWCVGGEWCRLPDTAPMLTFLRERIRKWGGEAGLQRLDWVIVNNLRRAA